MDYAGKQVVIIGLGLTGLSCVDFFLSKNVVPKVVDTRKKPAGIENLPKNIQFHTGGIPRDWLLAADLIVVSPGIAISTPEIKAAVDAGVEVIGDIELFCREVNQKNAKIIAITGSNGKSTVTTLVGQMAKAARIKTAVGGNIGLPVLSFLEDEYDLYVLELSSFQLETTKSLKAKAAVILNISEDHLDRYADDINHYISAKQRIYMNAEVCLSNVEDLFTHPQSLNSNQHPIQFGAGDAKYKLEEKNGSNWLIVNGETLINAEECSLKGRHNYLNVLAAIALAESVGIKKESYLPVLKSFSGLPHRFQLIKHENGISWINDSKATNVGSVISALNGLNIEGTLHLLLGGDSKHANLEPLEPFISKANVKNYCYGRDAKLLAEVSPQNSRVFNTLEESVNAIRPLLQPGDYVILSPACASLDQFTNYEERGNEFIRLANALPSTE